MTQPRRRHPNIIAIQAARALRVANNHRVGPKSIAQKKRERATAKRTRP